MKELMQLILALPLPKFRNFLRIKNNMKPNDLIHSILSFKAIDQGRPASEITEFPDPLALALKNFNEDIITSWNNSKPESSDRNKAPAKITEEDRLEFIITLFQEFDREYFPDLAKLKNTVESLITLYTSIEDGYSTYGLTTLLAAITFVSNEKKPPGFYSWYTKKIPKEYVFDNEDILNMYFSLREPEESRMINFLYKIERECVALNEIVDVFIEEYILSVVVALQSGMSVEEMLLTHVDFSEAITLREATAMLQACILDKGKDANDRITLFNKIYAEVRPKINMEGNESTKTGINEFKKNIIFLFSASKLPKLTMFVSAPVSQAIQPVNQAVTAQISNVTTPRPNGSSIGPSKAMS
jgi:hypothetical protein